MLNLPSGSSARSPRANSSSKPTPHCAAKSVKYSAIRLAGEPVDAGRAPGVWVVNTPPPRTASIGRVEREAGGDELADPLQPEEAGVALVGVEHVGLQAEGPQRPHAADAEHDLLAQPVVLVAAVEAVGDGDAVGGVAVDVGVEEVQRDAADVGPPHVDRARRRRRGRR